MKPVKQAEEMKEKDSQPSKGGVLQLYLDLLIQKAMERRKK